MDKKIVRIRIENVITGRHVEGLVSENLVRAIKVALAGERGCEDTLHEVSIVKQ